MKLAEGTRVEVRREGVGTVQYRNAWGNWVVLMDPRPIDGARLSFQCTRDDLTPEGCPQ